MSVGCQSWAQVVFASSSSKQNMSSKSRQSSRAQVWVTRMLQDVAAGVLAEVRSCFLLLNQPLNCSVHPNILPRIAPSHHTYNTQLKSHSICYELQYIKFETGTCKRGWVEDERVWNAICKQSIHLIFEP